VSARGHVILAVVRGVRSWHICRGDGGGMQTCVCVTYIHSRIQKWPCVRECCHFGHDRLRSAVATPARRLRVLFGGASRVQMWWTRSAGASGLLRERRALRQWCLVMARGCNHVPVSPPMPKPARGGHPEVLPGFLYDIHRDRRGTEACICTGQRDSAAGDMMTNHTALIRSGCTE